MRRSQIAPLVIVALVLVAIVLGLTMTGGPVAGRSEKRDRLRADDIFRIARFYVPCLADEAEQSLPDLLAENDVCLKSFGTMRLVDPYSDLPYRYEKISDTRYQVCASFERAELLPSHEFGGLEFDLNTGCVTRTYSVSLN